MLVADGVHDQMILLPHYNTSYTYRIWCACYCAKYVTPTNAPVANHQTETYDTELLKIV